VIIWQISKFQGELVFQNEFSQSVEFYSKLTGQKWTLTNIYASCTPEGRLNFLNWFWNIDIPEDHLWIIMGDFNLIRRLENRNRPGGDASLMQAFDEVVSNMGLVELHLSRQSYTWSNM
jgi:hypothetical protein